MYQHPTLKYSCGNPIRNGDLARRTRDHSNPNQFHLGHKKGREGVVVCTDQQLTVDLVDQPRNSILSDHMNPDNWELVSRSTLVNLELREAELLPLADVCRTQARIVAELRQQLVEAEARLEAHQAALVLHASAID
ncbi:hypothetical protein RCIP0075_00030 [Klebsiella phage RCIP0075]